MSNCAKNQEVVRTAARHLPMTTKIVDGPSHAEFNLSMALAHGARSTEYLDVSPALAVFILAAHYHAKYSAPVGTEDRGEVGLGLRILGYDWTDESSINFHGITSDVTEFYDWRSRSFAANYDFRSRKGTIEFGAPAANR